MWVMISVMNQCAKCAAITDGGQCYRFYFGVFVDNPESKPTPEGKPVAPGPSFQARGSEEVYYCDRCLLQAAARGEKLRSGFFLLLGLFAISVLAFLALASSPSFWAGLVALLLVAALGCAAYQRYRHLHAALGGSNPDRLRQAVSSNPKIQNMGDEWAITHRRQALQDEGADLFLTRRDHDFWSRTEEVAVTPSGRARGEADQSAAADRGRDSGSPK
jgi:hypothetical protein